MAARNASGCLINAGLGLADGLTARNHSLAGLHRGELCRFHGCCGADPTGLQIQLALMRPGAQLRLILRRRQLIIGQDEIPPCIAFFSTGIQHVSLSLFQSSLCIRGVNLHQDLASADPTALFKAVGQNRNPPALGAAQFQRSATFHPPKGDQFRCDLLQLCRDQVYCKDTLPHRRLTRFCIQSRLHRANHHLPCIKQERSRDRREKQTCQTMPQKAHALFPLVAGDPPCYRLLRIISSDRSPPKP